MGSGSVIRVLSVASECAPLVKTGGLADVVGALPGALKPQGVEVKTLLPGYPGVMQAIAGAENVRSYTNLFGGKATLLTARAQGLDLFILDAPHLYDRDGGPYNTPDGYDWMDNPERFAALGWVAAEIAATGVADWQPDILHGHDWQAGLAPYYLSKSTAAGTVRSVMTIHNIAFLGQVGPERMDSLRIDRFDYHREGLEFWGTISTLKAGLVWADQITTVSPTYAQELMTPDYGMGLDGLLRARRADVSGILNGIDTEVWNPATDGTIRAYKTPRGKAANKALLRQEFNMPEADGPLCVVVSRLSHQKGLDLLLETLPTLLEHGGQLVLLGTGDPWLEAEFQRAAHNENIAVHIGYDETLAHRMIAGGDAILVPSRYEPCGLTQLYGLRYGTVPLVGLTGGLADTVINASPAALARGVATGVQFHPITADALHDALAQLCRLYADAPTWALLQKNGMAQPVGWDNSAATYTALYKRLIERRL